MDNLALAGKKVVLRRLTLADAPQLVLWSNDPKTRRLLRGDKKVFTLAERRRWIRNLARDKDQKVFGIENTEGALVGWVGLRGISHGDNFGVYGIMIGRPHWHQGYGTEATELLLQYAFRKLRLHRVDILVFSFNVPAIRLYHKLGFVQEGRRRESMRYDGRGHYYDKTIMGMLARDWRKRNGNNNNHRNR